MLAQTVDVDFKDFFLGESKWKNESKWCEIDVKILLQKKDLWEVMCFLHGIWRQEAQRPAKSRKLMDILILEQLNEGQLQERKPILN